MLPPARTCFLLCQFSHWPPSSVHIMQTHNKPLSEPVRVWQLTWQEQRAVFLSHYPIFLQSNLVHPQADSSPWHLNSTEADRYSLKIDTFLVSVCSPYLVTPSHLTTGGFVIHKNPNFFYRIINQLPKHTGHVISDLKLVFFCFVFKKSVIFSAQQDSEWKHACLTWHAENYFGVLSML